MLHRPPNRTSSTNIRMILDQNQEIIENPSNDNDSKEKIKELEEMLLKYENTNISLMNEVDKLKDNLSKLITTFPKEFIFDKIIEDKCSICLDKYRLGDEIVATNCLHLFHKKCIDRSINSNCLNCPNCRFRLDNSVFLYLKFNLETNGTDFL